MGSESESGQQSAVETKPYELGRDSSNPGPIGRNRFRSAIIGAGIGVGLIGLAQWLAPVTDHQIANIVSYVIGVITTLFLVVLLHQFVRDNGHRLFVPVAAVVLLGAWFILFRLDGVSGELVPQFKFRFAKVRPQIRSLDDGNTASSPLDGSPEAVTAEVDSLGFLGTDRTGVIARRSFSVPTEASQVELLWRQGVGEGWSSFAVSGDRAVTLEQREEMECVTCYRLSDGEPLWIVRHEARHQNPLGGIGPRSTPSIHGGRVYAQGATGRVWCLDLASGETEWTQDLLELAGWDQLASELAITWGRAGSPLLVDGLCVAPYGGPDFNAETGRSLIAFDAETGATRWTSGEDQISFASPGLMTLGGKRQIVSVNETTITGHEVKDGSLLWEFDWPGQSNGGANCAMVIPAGEDRFLIGKGYGGGSALVEVSQAKDGSLSAAAVWDSAQVLKTKFTHACVRGDVAFAISNGSLEAVRIADAEQQWVQPRRSRFGQGQILLVEDTIVAQSEAGDVTFVAADPEEYHELGKLPAMESKTWNIPTIAGRHLLVRNDRQALCFLLPRRSDGK